MDLVRLLCTYHRVHMNKSVKHRNNNNSMVVKTALVSNSSGYNGIVAKYLVVPINDLKVKIHFFPFCIIIFVTISTPLWTNRKKHTKVALRYCLCYFTLPMCVSAYASMWEHLCSIHIFFGKFIPCFPFFVFTCRKWILSWWFVLKSNVESY